MLNRSDENGKYKLYTIKNVQDGKIVSKVANKISELPSNLPQECILKKNDIIMSLTGNVGRVGLVYEENAVLNQRVLKLIPKNNDEGYIYALFRDEHMKNRLENLATGTSQDNLSPIDMLNLEIAYPDKRTFDNFIKFANNNVKKIVEVSSENEKLLELREYILPLLLNGQIKIAGD